jgi:hypothetical protein
LLEQLFESVFQNWYHHRMATRTAVRLIVLLVSVHLFATPLPGPLIRPTGFLGPFIVGPVLGFEPHLMEKRLRKV